MRVRIDLAYDGAGFHGWARQPGLRTVQGELERALDTVLRVEGSSLTVAGRTDTGVHARGQVAHLDVDDAVFPAAGGRRAYDAGDALLRRLNGVLDQDVRIRRLGVAPAGFDARFSAIWRRYAYRIADRPEAVDPLRRAPRAGRAETAGRRSHGPCLGGAPGRARLRRVLPQAPGRHHDPHPARASLGAAGRRAAGRRRCAPTPSATTWCAPSSAACCAVGEGRRDAAWAAASSRAVQRDPAVTVVQPHGLTLEEVGYPADDELARQAVRARVVRTVWMSTTSPPTRRCRSRGRRCAPGCGGTTSAGERVRRLRPGPARHRRPRCCCGRRSHRSRDATSTSAAGTA